MTHYDKLKSDNQRAKEYRLKRLLDQAKKPPKEQIDREHIGVFFFPMSTAALLFPVSVN